jgi:hypothetical protein
MHGNILAAAGDELLPAVGHDEGGVADAALERLERNPAPPAGQLLDAGFEH